MSYETFEVERLDRYLTFVFSAFFTIVRVCAGEAHSSFGINSCPMFQQKFNAFLISTTQNRELHTAFGYHNLHCFLLTLLGMQCEEATSTSSYLHRDGASGAAIALVLCDLILRSFEASYSPSHRVLLGCFRTAKLKKN